MSWVDGTRCGCDECVMDQGVMCRCDGTRVGAPEKTRLQAETLTAGELLALEQGGGEGS